MRQEDKRVIMRHRAIELFHKRIDYIMRYGHAKNVAARCCGMCKYCGDSSYIYLDIDNIYCTRNEKALKVTDYRTCYARGKSNIKIISTDRKFDYGSKTE